MYLLYKLFNQRGVEIIGPWPTSGYVFEQSMSEVNGQFVGLVLDNHTQALLTDDRIDHWLAKVTPALAGGATQEAM